MKSALVFLATLLIAGAAADGVVDLTAKNFDAEVLESGKQAFVKFLAPW